MTDTAPLDIPRSALAHTLVEVVDHCGLPMAEALVERFGGTRIWIPRQYRPGHELGALGEAKAEALCAAFGGSELAIPRTLFTAAGRRTMIHRLRTAGWTHRAIALKLACSDRVVRDVLAGRAAPAPTRTRPRDVRQIDIEDILKSR